VYIRFVQHSENDAFQKEILYGMQLQLFRIWVKHFAKRNFHEPKFVYSVKIRGVTACITYRSQTVGKNVVCVSAPWMVYTHTFQQHGKSIRYNTARWDLSNMESFSQMVVPFHPVGSHVLFIQFFTYYGMLFLLLGSLILFL
jgi:hypothetical protein